MRSAERPASRPAVLFIDADDHLVLQGFALVICLMVFWTHRTNIGRLLRGEETRMRLTGGSPP